MSNYYTVNCWFEFYSSSSMLKYVQRMFVAITVNLILTYTKPVTFVQIVQRLDQKDQKQKLVQIVQIFKGMHKLYSTSFLEVL